MYWAQIWYVRVCVYTAEGTVGPTLYNHDADIPWRGFPATEPSRGCCLSSFLLSLSLRSALLHAIWLISVRSAPPENIWWRIRLWPKALTVAGCGAALNV